MANFLWSLKDTLLLFRKTFLTHYVRFCYSQFGEDVVLRHMFGRKNDGIYVDVGCYHPKRFSNTYRLYKRGWHGVNVDMEASKIKLFQLARPRDINVVAAVSDEVKTAKLYRVREFDLGTTIDEGVASRMMAGAHEVLEVTTRTLDDILAHSPYANKKIDLLSIDAEGHDFAVLKSINLDVYRPDVIVIEEHLPEIEKIIEGNIYRYLRDKGYTLHSWVHLSLIFKRQHRS